MKRALATVLAAGLTLLLAGCAHPAKRDYAPVLARFFLESSDSQAALVQLPTSGVQIAASSKPVITEFDIVNVEVARVELGDCLMFQLTAAAARDLYRLTAANQGRRLVLAIDGEAVGARRIERPFAEGTVLVFVERPDASLPALVSDMKKTVADIQRELERKS